MPRFIGAEDINYINNITKELVNDVIDTLVDIFKIDKEYTPVDIYGESVNGYYYYPFKTIACMMAREDEQTTNDAFGINREQNITFTFHRLTLEEINLYPTEGDVIRFNGNYYEIININDNKFLGGQSDKTNKHNIVCNTRTISKKKLNIIEF